MRKTRQTKARSYAKLVKAFEFNKDHNYCTRLAFCVMTGLSAGKSIAYCKRMVHTWACDVSERVALKRT